MIIGQDDRIGNRYLIGILDRIIGYYIWMVFGDYWMFYWRLLDRIIGWDYWIGLLDGFLFPKL